MMMFILSIAIMLGAGIAVVLFLSRVTGYKCSLPEFLALSFFISTGVITYQLIGYYFLNIPFSLKNIILAPLLLFLILIMFLLFSKMKRVNLITPIKPGHAGVLAKFLLVCVLIEIMFIFFLVVPYPVNAHDELAIYVLKAKAFHLAGGIPGGFFKWPEETINHPDYPLLVPFLITWIFRFTALNEVTANIIMPVFYVAFLMLFYSLSRKIFNKKFSCLILFLLATIPQVADYAQIVHADLILTAFTTCALFYLFLYIKDGEKSYLVFSALLMAFSLWVKNEAIVFAAAYIFIILIHFIKDSNRRARAKFLDAIIIGSILFFVSAPWFYIKASNSVVNSDMNLAGLTLSRLFENIKDIPIILNLFQEEVFGPKKWNIFWIIFFASIIWKRKSLVKGYSAYLAVFIASSGIGYFTAYMLMTGEPLYFYVNTTISRFMLHFAGISLLYMALLTYDDINEAI